MRRVFHNVERRDSAHPNQLTVVPFSQLLQAAKTRNAARTARRHEYVYRKDLSDVQAAYQRQFGRPLNSLTNETIIASRSALAHFLRVPVKVPENMENYFVLTLAPDRNADMQRILEKLATYAAIRSVSFDYPLRLSSNDPGYPDEWGLENTGQAGGLPGFDIAAPQSWVVGTQQRPIVVAIADTGVHSGLDDLQNRMWANAHEPVNGVDDDHNGFVDDVEGMSAGLFVDPDQTLGQPAGLFRPHGTMVAGVIAANTNNALGISGVAGPDNIRLMSLSLGTFSAEGSPCGFAELAQALWYAISPSLDPAFPLAGADVVNMSIGGDCVKVFLPYDIIMAALDAGLVLVASAGNDGASVLAFPPTYPAAIPGVISVAGLQRDGHRWPGSNYGYSIDLSAPARDIVTITYDPTNVGQTQAIITNSASIPPVTGTSMSAAFVSGGVAVLLGRFPDLAGVFMDDWLRATARDVQDPLGDGSTHVGDDAWTGAGLLDLRSGALAASNLSNSTH